MPSYALLSILISTALTKYEKKYLFILIFIVLFSYSSFVNTSGALSSSANPPQVEVLELEKLSGIPVITRLPRLSSDGLCPQEGGVQLMLCADTGTLISSEEAYA